jgi:hypothetical protein
LKRAAIRKSLRFFKKKSTLKYMTAVMQCFVEALYSHEPDEILSIHSMLVDDLLEKALGVREGALGINWEPLMSGKPVRNRSVVRKS